MDANTWDPADTWVMAAELEAFEADYVTTTHHGALVTAAVYRLRDLQMLADTQARKIAYQSEVIDQRNRMLSDLRDQIATLNLCDK